MSDDLDFELDEQWWPAYVSLLSDTELNVDEQWWSALVVVRQ